ncbi:MAG TPA: NUDIX hydrolase [Mycobacteriales bacterium]|nr:NUDIX hydrolase [Mycobacteriales bacterium]
MEVSDTPTSYAVTSSELIYRSGRVIDLRSDQVAMPTGSTATRDVVVHPGAVGVIALDESDRVLLLRQYRHPVGQLLWEPPAGLLDEPGEDPLDGARRELKEEAHVSADRWDVLVDAFTSPGMTSEAVRIYLARGIAAASGRRHQGEHEEADMPVEWVPLSEAVEKVLSGALHNPLAVMGILAADSARLSGFSGLRPADSPWPQMGSFRGSAATERA